MVWVDSNAVRARVESAGGAGGEAEAVVDDVVGALAGFLCEDEGLVKVSWVLLGVRHRADNDHEDVGGLRRLGSVCIGTARE